MPYTADERINLSPKVLSEYIISSQHRRVGNANKCVWTISFEEEVNCFSNSFTENWISNSKAWGLIIENDFLKVIGLNNDKQELKLAKFVDANKNNIWHGYPADYMNRAQDIPLENILKKWVTKKYITKAKMNKIRRGISCNL
ncbi:hypothetical protein [Flavobacterium gyeonganense]|uniref:Uncharacterized protein n=1 Tax=Flavobacterium gyeonganense TaxID=1310418 RepID=A0ABV5H7A1_9FLAO|nr:hypothetical protein [Flavobacterium gyeonganense]